MKTPLLALATVAAVFAAPLAGAQPVGHVPTRFQFCQHELQHLSDQARARGMSACLRVRAEAERVAERQCRAQVTGKDRERREAMRQCVYARLALPHDQLNTADRTRTATRARKPAPLAQVPAKAQTTATAGHDVATPVKPANPV